MNEIIVVDTGSTDRTREVAAELGAEVHDFSWGDDFSAARNETLRYATGDWIFWMDADDRLDPVNVERLRRTFADLEDSRSVYMMQCVSPVNPHMGADCVVSHGRLFRRIPELRWQRRVHESVVTDELPPGVDIRFSDVVIEHIGYLDPAARRRKLHRDMQILQMEYALNPDDPLTLFYLGWTHLELGQASSALRFLKRSLQRCARNRKAHLLLTLCLGGQGKMGEALEACRKGLSMFPNDTELLYHFARLLGESGDLPGAERAFLQLLSSPPDVYLQVGVELGLRGPKARFMLGLIYQEQGRNEEACWQFQQAAREQPGFAQAWIGLGQLCLAVGRWDELESILASLAACPRGEVYARVLRARWLVALSRFSDARRLLEEALALDPQLLWTRLVLSDLLVAEGRDWEACVRLQREILALSPGNELAQQRLEYFLRQDRHGAEKPVASRQEATADFGSSVVVVGP